VVGDFSLTVGIANDNFFVKDIKLAAYN